MPILGEVAPLVAHDGKEFFFLGGEKGSHA